VTIQGTLVLLNEGVWTIIVWSIVQVKMICKAGFGERQPQIPGIVEQLYQGGEFDSHESMR
jgi:hypothetical protein